jgi:hypothetical protein
MRASVKVGDVVVAKAKAKHIIHLKEVDPVLILNRYTITAILYPHNQYSLHSTNKKKVKRKKVIK